MTQAASCEVLIMPMSVVQGKIKAASRSYYFSFTWPNDTNVQTGP